jgi:hypothetical protein
MEAAETAGSQEEASGAVGEEKVVGKKRSGGAMAGKADGGCKNKKKRK